MEKEEMIINKGKEKLKVKDARLQMRDWWNEKSEGTANEWYEVKDSKKQCKWKMRWRPAITT